MTINTKFRWTFHLDTNYGESGLNNSHMFVKSVELPSITQLSKVPLVCSKNKKFTSLKVVYYDATDNRDFKKFIVSKLGQVQFKGTLVYYDVSGNETDKIIFDLGSATIKFTDLNYSDSKECTIYIEFEVKEMNFDEIKSKELSKDIKNDLEYIKFQKDIKNDLDASKSYSSKPIELPESQWPKSQWQPGTLFNLKSPEHLLAEMRRTSPPSVK